MRDEKYACQLLHAAQAAIKHVADNTDINEQNVSTQQYTRRHTLSSVPWEENAVNAAYFVHA
jgi:hypothetical protein